MARKVSPQGIKFIEAQEGTVYHVYLDSAGRLTAGTGHLLTVAERQQWKLGIMVTQEQVDKWLENDLATVEWTLNERVRVPLTQNQIDACASFTFNEGSQAFSGSTLLKKINQGNYQGAADEFPKWDKEHHGGKLVHNDGLHKRRLREQKLFLTPDAIVPGTPPIFSPPSTGLSKNDTQALNPPSEERVGGDDDRNSSIEPPTSVIPPTPSTGTPTPVIKTVSLPPSTGGTAKAVKIAWQLPSVSVIFAFIIGSIQSLVDHGYIKADEVGNKVFAFFIVNWQFIIYLAIAVIGYLCVKKVLSYVPSILQFINHSDKSTYDVNFVPHGQEGR